jgi:hypothetical protein
MMIGKKLSERYASPTSDDLAMALYVAGLAIMQSRGLEAAEFVDALLGLQTWPSSPGPSKGSRTHTTFTLLCHAVLDASGATADVIREAIRRVIAGAVMQTVPWPPSPEPNPDRIVHLLNRAASVVYAQKGFNAPGGQA